MFRNADFNPSMNETIEQSRVRLAEEGREQTEDPSIMSVLYCDTALALDSSIDNLSVFQLLARPNPSRPGCLKKWGPINGIF
jgi:hypothetical protein